LTNASYIRVEIQGAFAQDLEPVFPMPRQWLQHAQPVPKLGQPLEEPDIIKSWMTNLPNNREWIGIYLDLWGFSNQTTFDGHSELADVSPYFGAWTTAVIHRLLTIRPLRNDNTSEPNIIEEACRIASLLYIVPIWRRIGVFPVHSPTLVSKLRDVLSSHSVHWANLEAFHMWVLYMGCLEATGDDLEWFVHETNCWIRHYELQSWDILRDRVMSVLWIDNVFEISVKLVPRVSESSGLTILIRHDYREN
jgi:hypothetical protein